MRDFMNDREFEKGQRIEIQKMVEGDPPIPPGTYAIMEVRDGLFGSSYKIRSVPDEDIDAEIDHDTLVEVAKEMD